MENEIKEMEITPEIERELDEVWELSRLFVTMGTEKFIEYLREKKEKQEKEKKDC